jgi:hypothetical protein
LERRNFQRVKLERPCVVRTQGAELLNGVTRDIARSGASVAVHVNGTGRHFLRGQEIEIEIELEANPVFEPRCIHCLGTLLRAEWDGPGVATLAIEFNKVSFRDARYTGIHGECRSIT